MRTASLLIILAAAVSGQPKVGIIDYYGEKKISTDRLAKALGVKVGDPLPPNKLDLEDLIAEVGDVARSHVEATCCAEGQAILYVGVEERGARHFEPRMIVVGQELGLPPADQVDALIVAARDADDPSIRADATALLGDATPSQAVIDALQYIVQDPDPTVRRAAVRGLVRMYQAARSDREIQVQPTWIVEMLNSVVWSDRVNAVEALLTMSDNADPLLVSKIRDAGFASLLQMARWKHLEHALPPYLLLARISGIADEEAQSAWSKGERDRVLSEIQKPGRKK